jgi:AraC-like DNA-binding protein
MKKIKEHYQLKLSLVSMSASKQQVIDIALSQEYETISTFYRDVHRYFGMTPDKFRKLVSRLRISGVQQYLVR